MQKLRAVLVRKIHALSIAIIRELGGEICPCYRDQSIFGIVVQVDSLSADDARGLVVVEFNGAGGRSLERCGEQIAEAEAEEGRAAGGGVGTKRKE
jgi:hypothetical protein